jgi:hypothetical protein
MKRRDFLMIAGGMALKAAVPAPAACRDRLSE